MSKDLNQDDVFNGADAPEGVFAAQQDAAPRGGKGKSDAGPAVAKKGLSTKTYFIGGMVVLLVVMIWLKMPRSSDGGGEVDQMTGTELAAETPSENVPEPGVRPMPSEILPVPAQPQPQVEVAHQGSPELEIGLPVSKQVAEPSSTSLAPPNPDAADLVRRDTAGMPAAAQLPAPAPAPMPSANVSTPAAVDGSELARVSRDVATLKAQVAALLAHKDDRAALSVAAGTASAAVAKPAPRRASAGTRSSRASAKAEPAPKPELPPVTSVSLRAVVGDSAWVMTSTGESKQVSAGDVIPGAGVVKSVNAASGTVNLADGRELR
ncbi:MAG: hypothetical protein VB135_00040 [Burkholderia sp.]